MPVRSVSTSVLLPHHAASNTDLNDVASKLDQLERLAQDIEKANGKASHFVVADAVMNQETEVEEMVNAVSKMLGELNVD
ncbi:hypothetical protein F5876DRAFT_79576 [Lentinula aff. lateritia]|uniref:Uncharacterized protein n=1 Tax=Lentinula aff. lateritia TaxID=2804960 RepID=A0ACC1TSK7_9AGAR|nr:hypothetical protein F5876DRAFT_79576 [Lentinula aff. lateritia]